MQGSVARVGALPDLDDFFWEKDPTPMLDMVEIPMHLKNMSHKVTVTILNYLVGRSLYLCKPKSSSGKYLVLTQHLYTW